MCIVAAALEKGEKGEPISVNVYATLTWGEGGRKLRNKTDVKFVAGRMCSLVFIFWVFLPGACSAVAHQFARCGKWADATQQVNVVGASAGV